jgi:Mg2+ and Co2+ transporter CorA
MVDPAFAATLEALKTTSGDSAISPDICADPSLNYHGVELDSVSKASLETCLILQDPRKHLDRASLWASQEWNKWNKGSSLKQTPHRSWPYHNGCSTLAPLMFSQVGIVAQEDNVQSLRNRRNLVSALDEMVFYWTKVASEDLIKQTNEKSSNAAYYLLKHVAQHWVHQLELMNTTIAKAEWFSDDYQAKIDGELSRQKWKDDLLKVNEIAKDINYMRRHLNHFWRAMFLNLERLGVQLGSECVDGAASLALRGAQKDFLTIHTRMQPMRNRAEALNSVSNDLANLRAAFRGVYDGEFGLRLSLFASIFFSLSLLASIFSMGDDYRPGKNHFWMFWAIGPPICVLLALGLIYGTQPWKVGNDLWEYAKLWLRDQGLVGTDDEKAAIKQKKIDKKAAVKQKKIDEKAAAKQKKSDKKEKDEMLKGSKNATGSNNRARRKLDEEHAS